MTQSSSASESLQEAIELAVDRISEGAVLLSTFTVPRDFVPASNLAEIPHVLSTLVERSERQGPSKLLVFWTDRDSFTVGVQAFKKRAGLPADAEVEVSWITESMTPKVPWLRRIKPYAVLLAIAGFLGTLEALHNRYGLFFGSSQAVMRFAEHGTLNVEAGKPAELKLIVQNNSRVVAAKGKIETVSVHDGSAFKPLNLQRRPTFGPIQPGDTTEMDVPIGKLDRDSSSIEVVAVMEAGLFRSSQTMILRRPVEVWPVRSKTEYKVISKEPSKAWLQGVLAVAKPHKGLDCSVELNNAGTIRFDAILMAGVKGWDNQKIPSKPGAEFAQIQWRTPPLEAFSRLSYKLLLIADGEVSWAEVAQRLVTRCQPRG